MDRTMFGFSRHWCSIRVVKAEIRRFANRNLYKFAILQVFWMPGYGKSRRCDTGIHGSDIALRLSIQKTHRARSEEGGMGARRGESVDRKQVTGWADAYPGEEKNL